MAVFDSKSRYAKHAVQYDTVDARGRKVRAIGPAMPPAQPTRGDHQLKDHQRLDHLAAHYLDDPFGFWRIAEQNDAVLPDAATAKPSVRIPREQ